MENSKETGNEVPGVVSLDAPQPWMSVGSTTTSNNTIKSFTAKIDPGVAANKQYMVRVHILARKTNAVQSDCAFSISCVFNVNSTLDILNLNQNTVSLANNVGGYTATLSPENVAWPARDRLSIQVTGATGHEVTWAAWCEWFSFSL